MAGSESARRFDVVAFAGRRIDKVGVHPARFPRECISRVRSELILCFRKLAAERLVAAAACGSDLLALDVAKSLGMTLEIVLPTTPEIFKKLSVVDLGGDWGPLFDSVVSQADAGGTLTITAATGNPNYFEGNSTILKRATSFGLSCGAVIAWNGTPSGPSDVTEHFRVSAVSMGLQVMEIRTDRC